MLSIKLLGIGCQKSRELKRRLLNVLEKKAVDAPLQEIKDVQVMIDYNLRGVPALMLNDHIICEQKILEEEELNRIIQQYLDEINKSKK